MKILPDELRRRYKERRSKKTSLWSNWIIKVILLLVIILLIRHLTNIQDVFTEQSRNTEVEQFAP